MLAAAAIDLDAGLELVGKVLDATGLASPLFYAIVVGVALLELAIPADRSQRPFSRGFAFDLGWLFVGLLGRVAFLVPFVAALTSFYERHLSFLTLELPLPEPARLVASVLVADALAWLHHWVRHKLAWEFHAVHHSQTQLNLFTDDRNHFVDVLVAAAVRTLPMLMLSISAPAIVGWNLFALWFTRLYHANLRTNFGPLRYVLVTPQSHRIHHSPDPRHHEKNFGLLFSLWDHLLGTQWRDYDEYPETGIRDPGFPREQESRVAALPLTLLRQQIHPFFAFARRLRGAYPASGGAGRRA